MTKKAGFLAGDERAFAAAEAIPAREAERTLASLASALFPAGVGNLGQLTWEAVQTPPIPLSPPSWEEISGDGLQVERAKLKAAELRFRTLVEQIPAVTFMAVLGEGRNEVYVSPHIEALLGYTQREWLESPILWFSRLHPDDRALWYEEFARGCSTGGPFRAECRLIARDGRIVWVRGEARLIKDELGRPLFLQGVAFDITESKRAQEALVREVVRTTEEHYRDLVEQLGAIFWEADARTGRFLFVSQGAKRILGFSPKEWLDDPEFWLKRVHPLDRAAVSSHWRKALNEKGDHEFEFRAVTAADRMVWLQTRAHTTAPTSSGARSLGVILDISERKQWEAEIENLLLSEQLARAEAEALNRVGRSLAAELDLDQLLRLIADAGTELTSAEWAAFVWPSEAGGTKRRTFIRTSHGRYRSVEGSPADDPLLSATLNGATVRKEDRHRERATSAPGDITRAFDLRSFLGVPVVSRTGDVLGGLFFGHSQPSRFTERHEKLIGGFAAQTAIALDNAQLYDAAESARKSAEAANQMKDEFLATLSHELRSPLHAVLGWSQVLRAAHEDVATRERGLAAIERNARAQAQLMEDLLDVSRIVTGKLNLAIRSVDVASVVEAAAETIKLAADAKHIQVVKRLTVGTAIRGDADRLQQVIGNLLSNAVKFTPNNGRIEVDLDATDEVVRLRVRDTGDGIDPSLLPYVFDRFRQADSSTTRQHGGLGLGLAIARHLTEMHGGRIRAESAGRGQGATFIVELPREPSTAAGGPHVDETTPTDVELVEAASVLQGARILIVDDEADSRDLLQSIMSRAGALVQTAASVEEGIRYAVRQPPELIICDIGMPNEDGYTLVRRLRALGGAYRTLPVMAVTAYARGEDRNRALAESFQAHLGKPITADALLRTATRLVTQSRSS